MITRKINWVSSLDKNNEKKVSDLTNQLWEFYRTNPDYYSDIDFTANNWIDPEHETYTDIREESERAMKVLEVGCGSANILKYYNHLQEKYTGCDFSQKLMESNSKAYPAASFQICTEPDVLPFNDESFDLVFSIFVLEHSTHPAKLLSECSRVLRKNGKLILMCPGFLEFNKMSSQRAGYSEGTTKQKLKQRKFLDAAVTLFDNRVRIPMHCKQLLNQCKKNPQFFINLSPTVFKDSFFPDVDAVYVTCKEEIIAYLNNMKVLPVSDKISAYEKYRELIYLKMQK